jgi:hypothetical protein
VQVFKWWRALQILQRLPQPKAKNALLGNVDFGDASHHQKLLQWSKDLGGIFFIRIFWITV